MGGVCVCVCGGGGGGGGGGGESQNAAWCILVVLVLWGVILNFVNVIYSVSVT